MSEEDNPIPSYEKLLKMQNDPEHQTPLQREYNSLVSDDARLGQAILMQMKQMVGIYAVDPSWENFSSTKTWMSLSMNITEANRERYRQRWQEMYKQLLEIQPEQGQAVENKE